MLPLFLDCESAGLRGDVFAAALLDNAGVILFNGFFRHPALETNEWLRKNVEPNLTGTEYPTLRAFREAFVESYPKGSPVVAHMGTPVEANLFQQLYQAGLLGEFDGPYPMLDTAPLIKSAGFDPTSEEKFVAARGLYLNFIHTTHSALSDAMLTRVVWKHFMG